MNAARTRSSTTRWATPCPRRGATIEVAPGVRWMRMALPFALDHINLWLLRDDASTAAARAGPSSTAASPTTRRAPQWEQVFATQLDGLPVLRVIVTHMHPDHIGLAHWLCERWNARAVDQRHRLQRRRALASSATTGFGGDARGALLRQPRPGRPRGASPRSRARTQLLPAAWCRRCRATTGA